MNCFAKVFSNKKAFIGYVSAGQNGLDYTYDAACALVKGGVDILEIGLAFSDPLADGPTIQAAMTEALTHNYSYKDILATVKKIKENCQIPLVLFSYLNPLLNNGFKENLQAAKEAGVDGVLIVDLPLEFSNEYFASCKEFGLEPVLLISPSTSDERVRAIASHSNSFLYYVCRNGTTGVRSGFPDGFAAKMKHLQTLTDVPVVCGFGIGNREMAAEALNHAAGFVTASAFISASNKGSTPDELGQIAKEIDPR